MWDWIYSFLYKKNNNLDFNKKITIFKQKRAVRIIEKYYLNYIRNKNIKLMRAKRRKTYRILARTNNNLNNYIKKTHYLNKKNINKIYR